MDLGLNAGLAAAAGLAVAAVIAFLAARALLQLGRERREGSLVAVDVARSPAPRLASPRLRLAGRPDELRRRSDGRWVPVEFKSRSSPAGGPPRSHRVQVAAYCLLLEETTGVAPPHGLLRYGDGVEWEIPFTADARAEVLELLADVRRPYDGRATPGHRRCAGCGWRPGCPARAA